MGAGSAPRRVERDRDEQGRPSNARPRDRLGRPLPYDADVTDLARDWDCGTAAEALATGVALWDRRRYFEAHECLEDVWRAAPERDRDFWQGVVQVAVACCHHQRGNLHGSVALLDKAAARLAGYPDVHYGVDVEQLRVFAEGAAAALRQAGDTIEIGYPDFPAMDGGPWFEDPDGGEGGQAGQEVE